ncbi:MAG: hypothetical protein LBI19_04835 [Oscillospiraceae bacterium]|jgi:hypothetical protein|nr:hypothetical protein [Oscillospiraceae bacterium]
MANRINTNLAAVNGGQDFALLTGKSDIFPYENGKRTSDVRTGVRLNVALQGNRLTPLSIKYDHDPLPNVSDEQIEATNTERKFVFALIPDCDVSLFATSNGMIMSASAKTAKIYDVNGTAK